MFLDLANKRRSIRQFNNREISQRDIDYIMEVVSTAPSAKNRKPCEFIIVKNKKILEELADLKVANAKLLKNSALAIVVLVDKEYAQVTYTQDASIVSTFLLLAAADLGIGSCWVNVLGGERENGEKSEDFLKRFLEVPDKFAIESVVGMGYYDKEPSPLKEKDFSEKIHYDKY